MVMEAGKPQTGRAAVPLGFRAWRGCHGTRESPAALAQSLRVFRKEALSLSHSEEFSLLFCPGLHPKDKAHPCWGE